MPVCMQCKHKRKEKEGKKKSFEMDTFFWASRNSFQGIHLKMQMNRLSKVQKMKENLYLWRFFLPNCLLSSFKHKFCKSCYNNKWWIMCIIETCWLIGRQQLTESNTSRVNNFAAATNHLLSPIVPTYQLVLSKFSILYERWLSKRLEWAFRKKKKY